MQYINDNQLEILLHSEMEMITKLALWNTKLIIMFIVFGLG